MVLIKRLYIPTALIFYQPIPFANEKAEENWIRLVMVAYAQLWAGDRIMITLNALSPIAWQKPLVFKNRLWFFD
ncbi:MAG: hypothetical protein DSM106950_21440 [Stigonema ocellatum SAG 48.90 = DSM 106950]|nr:hypothetical protein [Stigonema ocellatum SAG 48.90 = DSM 106950]